MKAQCAAVPADPVSKQCDASYRLTVGIFTVVRKHWVQRDTAGLGPLAMAQASSVAAVIALATMLRQDWLPRDRYSRWAIIVGALAAGAALLFLLGTQTGLLTVASVLTSLYPAFTVLLAATLLRERIHAAQGAGLVLAAAAVTLVAAG